MTTTTSRISQIQLVMIPSTDQDRSVAFYEALGSRSVMTSHGAPATAGSRSTRRAARRVWFRDPDGNTLLIVEAN